jgi:predicted aspartyl protease
MVDSGATNTFISQEFVQANKVRTLTLRKPIPLYNVDGSHNSAGSITEYVELRVDIEGHQETVQFLVTDLGSEDVIMGITWLRKHNPSVNWKEGSLRLDLCQLDQVGTCQEDDDNDLGAFKVDGNHCTHRDWVKSKVLENGDKLWCCANFTYAQQFVEKAKKQERGETFEQIVPKHYQGFAKVFSEEALERLPEHCPGLDHPIDLTDDAPLSMNTKVYPLTGEQREWLRTELADQLR